MAPSARSQHEHRLIREYLLRLVLFSLACLDWLASYVVLLWRSSISLGLLRLLLGEVGPLTLGLVPPLVSRELLSTSQPRTAIGVGKENETDACRNMSLFT